MINEEVLKEHYEEFKGKRIEFAERIGTIVGYSMPGFLLMKCEKEEGWSLESSPYPCVIPEMENVCNGNVYWLMPYWHIPHEVKKEIEIEIQLKTWKNGTPGAIQDL